MPRLRKKSSWIPDQNRELAIEAYVESFERELLSHDFDVTYQRTLTKDDQTALEKLRSYDDIIIKQADKESVVVIMDKEASYLKVCEKTLFGDTHLLKQLLNTSTFSLFKFYFCSAKVMLKFLLNNPNHT